MSDSITITLSSAEAVVLFEYLHELDEQDGQLGEAERIALWRLAGSLEKSLTEHLAPDYRQLLEEAKETLKTSYGSGSQQG